MIIDTHSHLNFNAYRKDLDEVVKRTFESGIWVINVGSKYETSKKAVEIAKNYEKGMYASIGLHPIYAGAGFIKIKTDPEEGEFLVKEEELDLKNYEELAKSEKVKAIGEIGLDYYYKPKTTLKLKLFKEKQKEVFERQLGLANKLDLPVILHCRMAHQDMIKALKEYGINMKGVVHCFTGTIEEARQYMDLGLYIGLNGIIFKLNMDEVVKNVPLEKILVETDCPYLTPPQEKKKRNEPAFITHVIKRIAELKGESFEDIAYKTTENARKLFNI